MINNGQLPAGIDRVGGGRERAWWVGKGRFTTWDYHDAIKPCVLKSVSAVLISGRRGREERQGRVLLLIIYYRCGTIYDGSSEIQPHLDDIIIITDWMNNDYKKD